VFFWFDKINKVCSHRDNISLLKEFIINLNHFLKGLKWCARNFKHNWKLQLNNCKLCLGVNSLLLILQKNDTENIIKTGWDEKLLHVIYWVTNRPWVGNVPKRLQPTHENARINKALSLFARPSIIIIFTTG
jgi:hypothetical protein